MPRGLKSIKALRKLLAQRESELVELGKVRARLVARLSAIDKEIAQIQGATATAAPVAKPKAKGKRGRRGRSAPRGPMKMRAGKITLRAAVARVLQGASSALTANDIMERLPSTGYKSTSKNVDNMLRQLLYKCPEFRRVRRGKYAAKK